MNKINEEDSISEIREKLRDVNWEDSPEKNINNRLSSMEAIVARMHFENEQLNKKINVVRLQLERINKSSFRYKYLLFKSLSINKLNNFIRKIRSIFIKEDDEDYLDK